jgi:hypothetical protein
MLLAIGPETAGVEGRDTSKTGLSGAFLVMLAGGCFEPVFALGFEHWVCPVIPGKDTGSTDMPN